MDSIRCQAPSTWWAGPILQTRFTRVELGGRSEEGVDLVPATLTATACSMATPSKDGRPVRPSQLAEAVAGLNHYWLVTSDRELRRRAGERAVRVIGGGSYARELQRR